MELIEVDNVHQATPEGCRLLLGKGIPVDTRNGPALVLPTPLTTTFRNPRQRVVFWPERDANPFFHLMECLWMMSGRRDVGWISQFSSNISNYSDDGVVFNAAYGHRWTHYFGVNQIRKIIDALLKNPKCRRQVLLMWSAKDLTDQNTKDVPCNTSAYFQVNPKFGSLDMLVSNRSNDLLWGAYGANAVHFSFLMEVVAAHLGRGVGTYYQVSMNTHLYENLRDKAEALAQHSPDWVGAHRDGDPYSYNEVEPYPIVERSEPWWRDLDSFVNESSYSFLNSFFPDVASPLRKAWLLYKQKKTQEALKLAESCAATDWRRAAVEWLTRRTK